MSTDETWRGDPIAGVRQFNDDKSTKTRISNSVFGLGVRFQEKVIGTAEVYLPVQVSDGSSFNFIQLRGECSKDAGVAAELLAVTPEGAVTLLGSVSTVVDREGTYMQVRSAKLNSTVTADATNYALIIRITLNRNDEAFDPVAYELVLSKRCHPDAPLHCPPGPAPEPVRCPITS